MSAGGKMCRCDILFIDKTINELLSRYDTEKPWSVTPVVDIDMIAKCCGIKEIIPVPSSQLEEGIRAVIEGDTIKMVEEDYSYEGQRRFNIAHEIGHIFYEHVHFNIPDDLKHLVINNDKEPCKIEEIPYASDIVKRNKKAARGKISKTRQEEEKEELADHFAANLLVPIHRFQFWENKNDDEIAQEFNVAKDCIVKRRKELEDELRILSSAMELRPIDDIISPDAELLITNLLKDAGY